MLEVLLLQLGMCCDGKIHQGFCLGWCLVKQIPLKTMQDSNNRESFVVPKEPLAQVDFHSPMAALCRCLQDHAQRKGLQASSCWA